MQPIRYGVIGAGHIAEAEHLPVLASLDDAEVVAMVDPDPRRRSIVERIVGRGVRVHHDVAELLAADDIDAVLVLPPNDLHAPIAIAALEAGKHVFLEKPMGTTPAEATSVLNAQKRTGLAVQVGYVFRYSYLFREAKRLIDAGSIGTPWVAWCNEFRRPMPQQWRYSLARSGGAFVEKNCHHFDLFNWMFGQEALRAAALGGRAKLVDGASTTDILGNPLTLAAPEIPDNAVVTLEFQGGAKASLIITFFAPFRHRLEFGVFGDGGLLIVHEDRSEIEIQDARGTIETRAIHHPSGLDEPVHHGSVEQHRSFIRAVRGEEPVYCDLEMGLAGLVPAFMAERAMTRGIVVSRDDVLRTG